MRRNHATPSSKAGGRCTSEASRSTRSARSPRDALQACITRGSLSGYSKNGDAMLGSIHQAHQTRTTKGNADKTKKKKKNLVISKRSSGDRYLRMPCVNTTTWSTRKQIRNRNAKEIQYGASSCAT